jgi:phasin family protein
MNLVQAAGFPFLSVGLPKTWASFGAHSFKIDAVFEMHRKNADAVVRATCVVLDGVNRMAKRQGELLAAAVGEQIKVAHDVLTHGSFGENASNRVGAMRKLYVSNVSSFREQSDIAVNTNVAVADILTTRVKEAFDEFGMLLGTLSAPTSSVADTAVVAEPTADLEEAAVANEAALVEAVTIVGPAKTRPKKATPPAKPGRRPTRR